MQLSRSASISFQSRYTGAPCILSIIWAYPCLYFSKAERRNAILKPVIDSVGCSVFVGKVLEIVLWHEFAFAGSQDYRVHLEGNFTWQKSNVIPRAALVTWQRLSYVASTTNFSRIQNIRDILLLTTLKSRLRVVENSVTTSLKVGNQV